MKRILLKVAYDGTSYHGWQLQDGQDTIEGELNRALFKLTGENIEVIGASRTDAGVHALGNLAVFDTESTIQPEKFALALNTKLPADIKVMESSQVEDTFHPRKCNSIKTYEYTIENCAIPNPMNRLYCHFTYTPLELDRMKAAAGYLIGEHNFKSFCCVHTQAETTVRRIYSIQLTKENEFIRLRVSGNGFLYNMVRIIAGTLMEVGSGRLAPDCIPEMLAAKDRTAAGPTAPACGLKLVSIEIKDESKAKTETITVQLGEKPLYI